MYIFWKCKYLSTVKLFSNLFVVTMKPDDYLGLKPLEGEFLLLYLLPLHLSLPSISMLFADMCCTQSLPNTY